MSNMNELPGYQEAVQAKLANVSPRFLEIDRLERFVSTTQYDGKPGWFTTEKPLFDRKPCIAYPIVRAAIDSNIDLTLGEGRYPSITAAEEASDATDDLNELLADIQDQARCKRAFRVGFGESQGAKSVALICGVRNRKLFVDVERAKWCTPTFAPDDSSKVVSLEIRYPYLEQYRGAEGKWRVRAMLYRRVIDTEKDTTFFPAVADKEGREPRWTPNPDQTFAHGFGLCPVVWYAHMRGCSTMASFDGRAIHENQTDEITALDFALSQRHRAALLAGDPQWTEIGVGEGEGPAASGEEPLWSTKQGGEPTGDNPATGRFVSLEHGRKAARKKGPGEIWQYDNPDAKVALHTLPGDALKAISDHADDLRTKIAEGLAVAFTDPESVKHATAMSGKAQELLKSRQLDRCDQYRDDMADGMIRPVIYLLLLIAHRKRDVLRLKALEEVGDLLGKLVENEDLPELELRWGPYFKPDAEDEAKIAQALAAIDKVIPLSLRMKLRKLRGILGIENVEAVMHEIEEEQEKRAEKAAADMKAQADMMHATAKSPDGAVGTGNRSPAGKNPPPNAGGGGGPAPAGKAPNPAGSRRSR